MAEIDWKMLFKPEIDKQDGKHELKRISGKENCSGRDRSTLRVENCNSRELADSSLEVERMITLKSISAVLPAPRRRCSCPVTFTEKALPLHLPARESREKVQLKDTSHASTDSVDISEREPLFLQDKGNRFYQTGDYRSAINAYTKALEKNSMLLFCHANRGACFLHLKDPYACIVDCTKALELLITDFEIMPEGATQMSEKDQELEGPQIGSFPTSIDDGLMQFALIEQTGCLELLTESNDQRHNDIPIKPKGCGGEEMSTITQCCILSRRGSARCLTRDLDGALADFMEAHRFHPSNEGIAHVLSWLSNSQLQKKQFDTGIEDRKSYSVKIKESLIVGKTINPGSCNP